MSAAQKAPKLFASFNGGKASLSKLSLALLEEQKKAWPELREGYVRLTALKKRRIKADDVSVVLQCNPLRIKSSGAEVDPATIIARPCFLCVHNLPPVQQGILWRRRFLVLCNPAPIFPFHYTISHLEHRPQSLIQVLPFFLQLAKDFQPSFALLYNGPRCGASAPDHLHFQAVPKAAIPFLKDKIPGEMLLRKQTDGVTLFTAKKGESPVMIVAGRDKDALVVFLRKIIKAMKKVLSTNDEPMMNLYCTYGERRWVVCIFPRRKHRPDAFFKTGKDRLLISPGAVDMGGLLILPREEDFTRLDAAAVKGIFREVSLPHTIVEEVIAAL
jgi:hypothetical protein